jgi:hypothetical protein
MHPSAGPSLCCILVHFGLETDDCQVSSMHSMIYVDAIAQRLPTVMIARVTSMNPTVIYQGRPLAPIGLHTHTRTHTHTHNGKPSLLTDLLLAGTKGVNYHTPCKLPVSSYVGCVRITAAAAPAPNTDPTRTKE